MTDISRIDVADSHGERVVSQPTVYVYEAPVRLWHWVNALAILVLMVTGYLIGSPLADRRRRGVAAFRHGLHPLRPFRCGPDHGRRLSAARLLGFHGQRAFAADLLRAGLARLLLEGACA